MTRLGDYEDAIVHRLTEATTGMNGAFAVVRGATGAWRSALRNALHQERLPAAYVAFVDEAVGSDTREALRGARFSVFVGARSLRTTSDPRHGDDDGHGAFALIEAARSVLDGHEIDNGLVLELSRVRFVESDGRTAVYELSYRVRPVTEEAPPLLLFDDEPLVGSLSRMELEIGPLNVDGVEVAYQRGAATYRRELGPSQRTLIWRGVILAESHAALNAIESAIEALILSESAATVEEVGVRTFADCRLLAYIRNGGRTVRAGMVTQPGELLFEQVVA